MGDSGEGLVDAESRIQERMEEMQRERDRKKDANAETNPELEREIKSLEMARTQLQQRLKVSTHAAHKAQLTHALEDVEKKIATLASRR